PLPDSSDSSQQQQQQQQQRPETAASASQIPDGRVVRTRPRMDVDDFVASQPADMQPVRRPSVCVRTYPDVPRLSHRGTTRGIVNLSLSSFVAVSAPVYALPTLGTVRFRTRRNSRTLCFRTA